MNNVILGKVQEINILYLKELVTVVFKMNLHIKAQLMRAKAWVIATW